MCLNCGCMRAHDDMGKPGVNLIYEDVRRAADANGMTVAETLETIDRTVAKDRTVHPAEYASPSRNSRVAADSEREDKPWPIQARTSGSVACLPLPPSLISSATPSSRIRRSARGSKNEALASGAPGKSGRLPGRSSCVPGVRDVSADPSTSRRQSPAMLLSAWKRPIASSRISPEEFDEVAAELGRSLDLFKVPEREKGEVLAAFAAHKGEVNEGYAEAAQAGR